MCSGYGFPSDQCPCGFPCKYPKNKGPLKHLQVSCKWTKQIHHRSFHIRTVFCHFFSDPKAWRTFATCPFPPFSSGRRRCLRSRRAFGSPESREKPPTRPPVFDNACSSAGPLRPKRAQGLAAVDVGGLRLGFSVVLSGRGCHRVLRVAGFLQAPKKASSSSPSLTFSVPDSKPRAMATLPLGAPSD